MPWSLILRMTHDELDDIRRGETGGRLVEEQKLWVERERPRDLEQALLAIRQVARLLAREPIEPDEAQDVARAGPCRRLLAPRSRTGERHGEETVSVGMVQADENILDERQLAEELDVLERPRDAGERHLRGRPAGDRLARESRRCPRSAHRCR